MLPCGHPCGGFKDETQCLPCLEPDCIEKYNQSAAKPIPSGQAKDDYCAICWSSGMGEQPCVMLTCRHAFHVDCVMKIIKQRWLSPRIVFAFSKCPQCKADIEAPHCP